MYQPANQHCSIVCSGFPYCQCSQLIVDGSIPDDIFSIALDLSANDKQKSLKYYRWGNSVNACCWNAGKNHSSMGQRILPLTTEPLIDGCHQC